MTESLHRDLSRRERQIMDIVYRMNEVTAAEVMDNLPDAPGYSAVRAMLRILVDRGYLQHRSEGNRYVYSATVPREEAQSSALERVVTTFFDNSVTDAVAALINMSEQLSEEELNRLSELIARSRNEGH